MMMSLAEVTEYAKHILINMMLLYWSWVLLIVFLALINKSFGVRYVFVKIMILIFEWGKQRVDKHEYNQAQEAHNQAEYDEATNINESGDTTEREVQLSTIRTRSSPSISIKHEFSLSDVMYFAKSGIETIIEDEVTQRFSAAELPSWNLLTRTNTKHEFISYRLTILWFLGWFLRYIILLPFRLSLAIVAIVIMIVGSTLIGYILPQGSVRRKCYYHLSVTCYRIMSRAFSAIITYHNKENRAKGGGICVANHTSPIDIIILGTDNTYAMVGQEQQGFFGIMQRTFSRGETHIWFNRADTNDRFAVLRKLKEHIEDKNKLPILIFPEGTCINNTSIMMFKKGSFETGGTTYPVTIKYDSRFADPFWNSSTTSLLQHLLLIMTSWSLVVDIYYMPPVSQLPNETSIEFANRVKADIARQGGLVDLQWDGSLKRSQPKNHMKEKQQETYSRSIKNEKYWTSKSE